MKVPRDLSWEELIRHLCKLWEYRQVHQVGATSFCKPSSRRPIESPYLHTIRFELGR